MKRRYTIELEDGENTYEIKLAIDAWRWKNICWEMDQWLRSKTKYEDVHTLDTQDVRNKLWELLKDENLNFDEV
jgi:hypothetical protein